jgi:hypothetical protein
VRYRCTLYLGTQSASRLSSLTSKVPIRLSLGRGVVCLSHRHYLGDYHYFVCTYLGTYLRGRHDPPFRTRLRAGRSCFTIGPDRVCGIPFCRILLGAPSRSTYPVGFALTLSTKTIGQKLDGLTGLAGAKRVSPSAQDSYSAASPIPTTEIPIPGSACPTNLRRRDWDWVFSLAGRWKSGSSLR